jgi:hypothetical protein
MHPGWSPGNHFFPGGLRYSQPSTATTWYVRKTGSDSNGGTSPTVRSTGTDGITSVNNTFASASASWTSSDIGHGLSVLGSIRKIAKVIDSHTLIYSGAALVINSGLTWTVGGALLTIGKSMASTNPPLAGGDTVYIGAGTYRETVTVGVADRGQYIYWIGDVDGSHTGDSGMIYFTSYSPTWRQTVGSGTVLNLGGINFLSFKNIIFVSASAAGGQPIVTTGNGNTCHHTQFINCCFLANSISGNNSIFLNPPVGIRSELLVDGCIFLGGGAGVSITLQRSTAGDYDIASVIRNSMFIGTATGPAVQVAGSGSVSGLGGGVTIHNCTILGYTTAAISTTAASSLSTTYPTKVYNCILSCTVAMNAATSGQIVEDYNVFYAGTPRTNVTAGAHSISDGSIAPLIEVGQSQLYGFAPKPFGSPSIGSPLLGLVDVTTNLVSSDMFGVPRPSGTITLGDSGTASSGAAKTITDSTKTWGNNSWAGFTINIKSGTGSGQLKSITSNTATVITVDGNWKTNPDNTSTYIIYDGALASSGNATAGSTTTLTDSNAAWPTNSWQGYTVLIDGGTGSGKSATVTSNTGTVLTFANIGATLDNTSTYQLYRGTSGSVVNDSVGHCERPSVIRDTATVHTSSNSWRIHGPGFQDFQLPVSAVATTATIWVQFDANYAGPQPGMLITNGAECGVSDVGVSMGGVASATWEQVSVTFTPTSSGIVTVRLLSNCTNPTGAAYFDDFGVS